MADPSEPDSSSMGDTIHSDDETVIAAEAGAGAEAGDGEGEGEGGGSRLAEILQEERREARSATPPVPLGNGIAANRYHELLESQRGDTPSEDGSMDGLPRRAGSPIDSLLSAPGLSPSVQGSVLSSPSSSVLPSAATRPGLSPTASFRPFDRRFQSRIGSPSALSPRPSSPAFLSAHSRNASLSSQFILDPGETETTSPPWEVVRWTKLKKLTGQAFSETGRRNFGSPTCLAVSASIVLGTSKGIILMFDYNQNLKMIIGPGTKAVESGAITSIAVSADHTTVGAGHADGCIFTWDTTRAARPFLHIPHLDPSQMQNRTVDGHVPNVAVTHLGFLGTRHTALVSADDRGMAFSHLATRGTGSLGRTVKTTRILGRYPGSQPPPGKPFKPSTVLAFAPLPLGNVERGTDSVGLTAMLTPYLLVIVSTTPVAQTQHKSPRPKEVAPHSAMSGCLAWFPAVRLKVPDPKTGSQMSKVKLVYCWSNVLTVLDVDEIPAESKDKPPSLHFKARSRWRCEEAIVAVQWLSRSVLTVLTITQRLIVLEDQTMRMTEAFDLIHKQIYHADLFSKQLYSLVEQHDEEDQTMHGVVADCFSMSFKAYKGRIFLLGVNDVSIGALSNWADRLIALMEHGDYVAAIQLATSYYTGDADKLTIGLPEDANMRHSMVQEKLMEIMAASLKYAFGQRKKNRVTTPGDSHLQELAETCFAACLAVGDTGFLFDEVYEWYEDAGVEGIFLETLEPYILDKSVTSIPPVAVKAMVAHFVGKGLESRLEEMICHMDTVTMDLDQITSLCKQHSLYDALIYVWNQALFDFITPLIELLTLLVPLLQNGEYEPSGSAFMDDEIRGVNALKMFPYLSYVLTGRVYPTEEIMSDEMQQQAKAEIYWFLFSGKSIAWPRGTGKVFLTRPTSSLEPSFPYLRMILKYNAPDFLSCLNEAFEDSFLNDSPEKQLVNGNAAAGGSGGKDLPEEQVFGATVDRQYIVSILTEIMNPAEFAPHDTIYLDMFIARNLPKYPQYLLLPGSTLTAVLTGLCNYPGPDLADDAQLSAEYLLSVYHPPDLPTLIPLFRRAGFFRILKRIYRVDQQYGRLIETFFEDPADRHGVFDCISDCLRQAATSSSTSSRTGGLTRRQLQDVLQVIRDHARELVELDPVRAALALDGAGDADELHRHVLGSVEDEPELQHIYLKTILEPGPGAGADASSDGSDKEVGGELKKRDATTTGRRTTASAPDRDLVEHYVRLMCRFEPGHVSDYVGLVQSADLRLERLLPTMEEMGVIDAAIVLMAREGQIREAMGRLIRHLHTLESALTGLLSGAPTAAIAAAPTTNGHDYAAAGVPDKDGGDSDGGLQQSAEDLLGAMRKYIYVGIWLCQGQTKTAKSGGGTRQKAAASSSSNSSARGNGGAEDLSPDESLWLSLVDVAVQITRSVSSAIQALPGDEDGDGGGDGVRSTLDTDKLVSVLRSLVQHTFTALLTATSTAPAPGSGGAKSKQPGSGNKAAGSGNNMSFLRIMRAFLSRAAEASPSLADLRAVLASIFSAYAYEESILRLSNRLLERSLFVSVKRAVELRQRGWRPRGSTCEACGRRVTGPGVAGNVLQAWEEREAAREAARRARLGGGAKGALGNADLVVGGGGAVAAGGGHEPGSGNGSSHDDNGGGDNGKGKGKAMEMRPREEFQIRGAPPSDGDEAGSSSAAGGTTAAQLSGSGAAAVPGSVGGRESRTGTPVLGPLVVLACRHIYHQRCLDALQDDADNQAGGSTHGQLEQYQRQGGFATSAGGGRLRQYRCPIDG